MIKKYVDMIIKKGNQEDMEKLDEIFEETMCDLKEYDHSKYKKYKTTLMGMAYNYQIDDELAHEIVENMKPFGEKWSMEEVASVLKGDTHNLDEMYVVLNSLYNDYSSILGDEDTELYIKMAHAWLDDLDAKEHKFWKYFVKD